MLINSSLETNDSFKAVYVSTMNGYIGKGYAESVPMWEQIKTGKNVLYLPHHGVLKNKGAAKLRVVFDCAATCGGTSLNKQLNIGPDLLNNFCRFFLRFRQYSCTLVVDIDAMFHQVKVAESDRDSLRFPWW